MAAAAASAAAAPLLEKKAHYVEGCPGCAQDRKNAAYRGVPYGRFIYIWAVTLCTSLPISSLFPFLYFMIRDLGVAKTEEDIGFYAGFVGASFMLGRALTSTFWGIVADRHGRKPVIILGVLAVIIFNTLFGLSVNYWMALTSRFLLGALNGLLGPIKAYSIEVCRPEHHALALSLVSTAWAIGLIIGPALGGYLAQPADKYPYLFSQGSLFGRFPYLLPCLAISIFATGVSISCIWLPETLHIHKENHTGDVEAFVGEARGESKQNVEEHEQPYVKQNLFKNWPLMSSIILYCIFSLHDMAYTEIFSLWAESNRKFGGLSYSTEDVGQVLAISGFSLLIYNLFIYPRVQKIIGVVPLCRVASALTIPLLSCYPFMTYIAGFGLSVALNVASVLKNVLSVSIITGTFLLQNNAVPQDQRGAANGLSMTAMSFSKAVAPAASGALFSWAQRRQHALFFPGDQMIFFILNVIELVGFIFTFKPFIATPEKKGEQIES